MARPEQGEWLMSRTFQRAFLLSVFALFLIPLSGPEAAFGAEGAEPAVDLQAILGAAESPCGTAPSLAQEPVPAVSSTAEDALSEILTPDRRETAAGGYCRCGCGVRCRTSADCGGAACVKFITCC